VTAETQLGPGAEFDAIRALLERWGPLAVGIGDDAATLAVPRGEQLVASVDAAVEGRHFRRGWLSPREIGYRATAAALSDLAAMAASPVGILVSLVVPDSWRGELLEIADGIGEAARISSVPIRGGNMAGGEALSLTTSVFGSVFTPLLRSGAKPGDRVYVTGSVGGSIHALRAMEQGEAASRWRERFAHPIPRLREARWLAEQGATAAIDVSDGLIGDARHLAAASGACITLDAANIPCVDGVEVTDALASGEEYELLVTSASPIDADAFASRFALPLTEIGRVERGTSGDVRVIGARVANVAGHDHFSR
jgi:thiamine-monophosphate kinase